MGRKRLQYLRRVSCHPLSEVPELAELNAENSDQRVEIFGLEVKGVLLGVVFAELCLHLLIEQLRKTDLFGTVQDFCQRAFGRNSLLALRLRRLHFGLSQPNPPLLQSPVGEVGQGIFIERTILHFLLLQLLSLRIPRNETLLFERRRLIQGVNGRLWGLEILFSGLLYLISALVHLFPNLLLVNIEVPRSDDGGLVQNGGVQLEGGEVVVDFGVILELVSVVLEVGGGIAVRNDVFEELGQSLFL